jgi:hypothetical protein
MFKSKNQTLPVNHQAGPLDVKLRVLSWNADNNLAYALMNIYKKKELIDVDAICLQEINPNGFYNEGKKGFRFDIRCRPNKNITIIQEEKIMVPLIENTCPHATYGGTELVAKYFDEVDKNYKIINKIERTENENEFEFPVYKISINYDGEQFIRYLSVLWWLGKTDSQSLTLNPAPNNTVIITKQHPSSITISSPIFLLGKGDIGTVKPSTLFGHRHILTVNIGNTSVSTVHTVSGGDRTIGPFHFPEQFIKKINELENEQVIETAAQILTNRCDRNRSCVKKHIIIGDWNRSPEKMFKDTNEKVNKDKEDKIKFILNFMDVIDSGSSEEKKDEIFRSRVEKLWENFYIEVLKKYTEQELFIASLNISSLKLEYKFIAMMSNVEFIIPLKTSESVKKFRDEGMTIHVKNLFEFLNKKKLNYFQNIFEAYEYSPAPTEFEIIKSDIPTHGIGDKAATLDWAYINFDKNKWKTLEVIDLHPEKKFSADHKAILLTHVDFIEPVSIDPYKEELSNCLSNYIEGIDNWHATPITNFIVNDSKDKTNKNVLCTFDDDSRMDVWLEEELKVNELGWLVGTTKPKKNGENIVIQCGNNYYTLYKPFFDDKNKYKLGYGKINYDNFDDFISEKEDKIIKKKWDKIREVTRLENIRNDETVKTMLDELKKNAILIVGNFRNPYIQKYQEDLNLINLGFSKNPSEKIKTGDKKTFRTALEKGKWTVIKMKFYIIIQLLQYVTIHTKNIKRVLYKPLTYAKELSAIYPNLEDLKKLILLMNNPIEGNIVKIHIVVKTLKTLVDKEYKKSKEYIEYTEYLSYCFQTKINRLIDVAKNAKKRTR